MRRSDFAQAYQSQVVADVLFNKRLIWASVLGFGLSMALGLLLPMSHRWIAALSAASLLLGLLAISAVRNARVGKKTPLRCSSCSTSLLEQQTDAVIASGICPKCGAAAFEGN